MADDKKKITFEFEDLDGKKRIEDLDLNDAWLVAGQSNGGSNSGGCSGSSGSGGAGSSGTSGGSKGGGSRGGR